MPERETPQSPQWIDPFSPEGLREATSKILTGMNYRLFYEEETRHKLIDTYRELTQLARKHPHDDEKWKSSIREMVEKGSTDDARLRQWLIGLTKKTADNLGIKVSEYPSVFDRMMEKIEATPGVHQRDMALLLWCGSATLTVRGSQKSKVGKSLERAIASAALTTIGLNENRNEFRLNVLADEEVARETDAEIRTPRGFIRLEVGLIGRGNSEVISDKVGRMERNGVVLMDILPKESTAYQTAANSGVRLIQMRNNHPVEELRQHLVGIRVNSVRNYPITPMEVEERIMEMPLNMFNRKKKE